MAHRLGNIAFLHDEADVDFRCALGDHPDVYGGLGDCVKYAGRYAGPAMNIFADQADDGLLVFASDIGDLLKF